MNKKYFLTSPSKLNIYISLTLTALAITVGLPAQKALAWGDLGHALVGALAEENIKPTTKDFVRSVMGIEPLAVSAVFPDHVRDDRRFGEKTPKGGDKANNSHDFGDYHFCEIPPGFTYDSKPKKDIKDCYGAIVKATEVLKDTTPQYSRELKMLALRYLVHVMGDIHQPLHVGTGHDVGANTCLVKWQNSNKPINFHSFWDTDLVEFLGASYGDTAPGEPKRKAARYQGEYVSAMKSVHPELFTEQAKTDAYKGTLKDWLMESQQIRDGGVYPEVNPDKKEYPPEQDYRKRPYCVWYADQEKGLIAEGSPSWTGEIDKNLIPSLDPETYGKKYAKVVESQILKAGLRLAATLDEVAEAAAKSPTAPKLLTDDIQEQILKTLQDLFKNSPKEVTPVL